MIEETITSSKYQPHINPFLINTRSTPDFLHTFNYNKETGSDDYSKCFDLTSIFKMQSDLISKSESNFQFMLRLFPGIREMTDTEANEYYDFLNTYFD